MRLVSVSSCTALLMIVSGLSILADVEAQSYGLIYSSLAKKCVSVDGFSRNDGANINIFDCSGQVNQRFVFEEVHGGTYRIRNQNSNKCLAVHGVSLKNGANVEQQTCHDKSHQLWRLRRSGESVQIIASHSTKCLNLQRSRTSNGSNLIQYGCGNWGANSVWRIQYTQVPDTLARAAGSIVAAFTNRKKCIDVAASSKADGANILVYNCHGSPNQKFTLEEVVPTVHDGEAGAKVFRIRNQLTHKCLAVEGASAEAKANVEQQSCTDLPHQLWRLSGSGSHIKLHPSHSLQCLNIQGGLEGSNLIQSFCVNGGVTDVWRIEAQLDRSFLQSWGVIYSPFSAKCADVQGSSMVDGGNIILYSCHLGLNQEFKMEQVHSGVFRIRNRKSFRCFTVQGASQYNEANVEQAACRNQSHQLWRLLGSGDNVQIQAVHSGKCIKVAGDGTANVINFLVQDECRGSPNSQWRIDAALPNDQRFRIDGQCVTEVENVSRSMTSSESKFFCTRFLGAMNEILDDERCEYAISTCDVVDQDVDYSIRRRKQRRRQRRKLGQLGSSRDNSDVLFSNSTTSSRHKRRKLGKRKKNKVRTINTGKCNDSCHDEPLLSGASRRQLMRVDRSLTSAEILSPDAVTYCGNLLKSFSERPEWGFRGMDKVTISCGGDVLISCTLFDASW